MAATLITNIHRLLNIREESKVLRGKELSELPVIENAWLRVEDDVISGFGPMHDLPASQQLNPQNIDAKGATVMPCWCDSHTHLVFAGTRESEFVARIKGLTYAQINAEGGGILNSAKKLNEATEQQLFNEAWQRLTEISRLGTGSVEIKSGYGLTVEGELKMLRVIKKLREKSGVSIKSTFLGAHTYPLQYKDDHEGYIKLIIEEMLPVIAIEKLADYIDVFCENGFFTTEETAVICNAGLNHGLKPKLHVNQLNSIGGIETGVRLKAISLDHLEILTPGDLAILKNTPAAPVCTLLPGAAFFLRMPLPSARELIDAGSAVAIASDYNPGSCPTGNMNLMVAMSCIQMKMLPEEAINAATINGAFAMELGNETGSITVGKKADLIFTKPIPSVSYIPYVFGTNLIDHVMIGGEFISME